MRLKFTLSLALLVALLVTACNREQATPVPTNAPTATVVPEAPTEAPTEAATEVATEEAATEEVTPAEATPVAVDVEAIRATLTDMLLQSLTVSVPVTSGVGIDGAIAFPLTTTDESVLWLAHTTGIRNFDPMQEHLMAIYAPEGDSWVEVARSEFSMSDDPDTLGASPDYLGEGGVTQVQIEPAHIWIQVEGGAGAHSGVFGLYSFDGSTLTQQLDGFSSSPGVGYIEDLNNDGINEVLIDATDYYIFCYACGVREYLSTIWYWDGSAMSAVTLQPLSEDAPEEVRTFNDNLIALVEAGLWKDAQALLDDALIFSYAEPALSWNLVYVRVNAEARQADAEGESAYPLLSNVFYGDYAAAVEILRAEGADGLFIPETALITGTVAAGWQDAVADHLVNNATAALALQPELAAAYFVRGWGEYVRNFDEAAAVADVQKAAELAPDDELYNKSTEFLTE